LPLILINSYYTISHLPIPPSEKSKNPPIFHPNNAPSQSVNSTSKGKNSHTLKLEFHGFSPPILSSSYRHPNQTQLAPPIIPV
jgi:hypothetical protein